MGLEVTAASSSNEMLCIMYAYVCIDDCGGMHVSIYLPGAKKGGGCEGVVEECRKGKVDCLVLHTW